MPLFVAILVVYIFDLDMYWGQIAKNYTAFLPWEDCYAFSTPVEGWLICMKFQEFSCMAQV